MTSNKILLRFDDICPTMNWQQWSIAKSMIDKVGAKAMLGVIPDCTDPDLEVDTPKEDFWDYIRSLQQQGFAIAMHGLHHRFDIKADGIVTRKKISEFAGLPYETQLERIRKGKETLSRHGIYTDIFFAPAHSYDDNTLKALAACGFKYNCDGFSNKPYFRHGIKILPCRSGGIPRKFRNCKYLMAVIHAHEWVREDRKKEYNKYIDLLANHAHEIVPFSEFCKWSNGFTIWQRMVEMFYLFAKQYVVPMVLRLKRAV